MINNSLILCIYYIKVYMRRVKFIPGKLKQWSCYKKNNIIIWYAGINDENINNDIV